MEENYAEVLARSETIPQKKKLIVAWIIAILLLVTTIIAFIVDYSGYKKGQEFGVAVALVVSETSDSEWVSQEDSYLDQCEKIYKKLNYRAHSFSYDGVKFDARDINKSMGAVRASFAEMMNLGGFDRYDSGDIADWFKYTNFVEYFGGYYWKTIIPIICYIALISASVFTYFTMQEKKKELIVYGDSVQYIVNSKKSKHLA